MSGSLPGRALSPGPGTPAQGLRAGPAPQGTGVPGCCPVCSLGTRGLFLRVTTGCGGECWGPALARTASGPSRTPAPGRRSGRSAEASGLELATPSPAGGSTAAGPPGSGQPGDSGPLIRVLPATSSPREAPLAGWGSGLAPWDLLGSPPPSLSPRRHPGRAHRGCAPSRSACQGLSCGGHHRVRRTPEPRTWPLPGWARGSRGRVGGHFPPQQWEAVLGGCGGLYAPQVHTLVNLRGTGTQRVVREGPLGEEKAVQAQGN